MGAPSKAYKKIYVIKPSYITTLKLFKKWEASPTLFFPSQIDVSLLNSEQTFKLGEYYFRKRKWNRAAHLLELTFTKNPLHKKSLEILMVCYKKTRNNKKLLDTADKLSKVKNLDFGPYAFEDGGTLDAFRLPKSCKRKKAVALHLFIKPPSTFFGTTAFLSFAKGGNFYFGRDIGFSEFKKNGETCEFKGFIPVPPNIPVGVYNIYFTFRISKTDYRYHVVKENKVLPATKILGGKIKISDK